MPKINIYLPDDLAASVRAAELPVSAICQKALADAVRTVNAARKGIEALHDPTFDPDAHAQFASRITDRMTPRLGRALELAREASAAGPVSTVHLLLGILDQGDNLAIRVLQSLGQDVEELRTAAAQMGADESLPNVTGGQSLWSGLTMPARVAVGSALEASIELGHNYLGCEHLLLGLVDVPEHASARVLGAAGIDRGALRRAVASALAGFTHAKAAAPEPGALQFEQVLARLDAIERRLGAADV